MKYLLFILLCLWNLISYSQQRVGVGQKCPDIKIFDVVNYKASNMKLSQFKGKPIIIDFWNTGCSTCIEDFHRIDSLQHVFNNKIQFLLVNSESRDSTIKFFKKRRKIVMPKVPMITGDHTLSNLFPHYGFPYQVWLDEHAVVRYIMPAYNSTFHHIEQFLAGKSLSVQNYKPNYHSGISNEIENWSDKMDYYSFISHCNTTDNIENLEGSKVRGKSITISCNCLSIVELFKKAFREYDKHNFNTRGSVILKAKGAFNYVRPKDPNLLDKWKENYSFNYALLLPISKAKNMYKIMQDDLSQYFDFDASVEKLKAKCIVLVRTSDIDKIATKGGTPIDKFTTVNNPYIGNDTQRYIQNMPFSTFQDDLSAWIESYTSMPFYDETGYVGNIDIKIRNSDIDPFNLSELKADLKRYDLDLVEKKRLIDVLILKKR